MHAWTMPSCLSVLCDQLATVDNCREAFPHMVQGVEMQYDAMKRWHVGDAGQNGPCRALQKA